MSRPGGQQFRQRNDSESGMAPAMLPVLGPQIHSMQRDEVLRPHTSKFVQQLPERLTLNLSNLPPTIKGLKCPSLAKLQDHPRPWYPVCALGVNQMADNLERAPGVFTFVSKRQRLRQAAQ